MHVVFRIIGHCRELVSPNPIWTRPKPLTTQSIVVDISRAHRKAACVEAAYPVSDTDQALYPANTEMDHVDSTASVHEDRNTQAAKAGCASHIRRVAGLGGGRHRSMGAAQAARSPPL